MSSISSTTSSTPSTTSSSVTTPGSGSTTAAALAQLIASNSDSSGLNDNNIISELVSVESAPIVALQAQQTALQTQISSIAQISSALQALATASQALQQNGVVGLTAGANTGFTASAAFGATPGTYQVDVETLAIAAKARSQGFASTDTVTGGTLNLTVQGTAYAIDVTDGSSLQDVVSAIQDSGAPVSASIISDGTDSYLSITNSQSGYPTTGTAADALSTSFTATGTQGQAISFSSVATAQNATLTVDGLPITSQSNAVTNVIPGITLNLVAQDTAAETLNIQPDTSTTASNIQTFVTAYNSVMSLVQAQLNVQPGADATTSLAGDPTLTNLEQRLSNLFSATIPGATDVNSLPDIGLTTDENGSLSLDTSQLAQALAQDPNAVNNLFGDSTTSIAALAQQISTDYTEVGSGALSVETTGINTQIGNLTAEESDLQAEVATYQQNLIAEFSNMETIVSSLKSTSTYLTQQSAQADKSS